MTTIWPQVFLFIFFNSYTFVFLRLNGNNFLDNMIKEGIYIFDDEKEFLKALKELQKQYAKDEE